MRPISTCLNKQLAELCQRSAQLEELSNKVTQFLPPLLTNVCRVGSFNKGCLTLITADAVWASQLRYAVPELRDSLRKAGMYQLSSIKITVSELHSRYEKPKLKIKHTLSETAKTNIISESQNCTYEPLKKALLDLADGE